MRTIRLMKWLYDKRIDYVSIPKDDQTTSFCFTAPKDAHGAVQSIEVDRQRKTFKIRLNNEAIIYIDDLNKLNHRAPFFNPIHINESKVSRAIDSSNYPSRY